MQGITSGETIRFPCFTVTSRQVVARKEIVNFTLSHLSHHQNQIAHNKNHRSEKKKKSAGQSASVEKETELTFQAGKHQLHRCCLTHIFAFCDISDFHHLQPLNHAFNLLSKLFPQ